jgi:hypothetical protein
MNFLVWGEGFVAYAIADTLTRTNAVSWQFAMLLGCATSNFISTKIHSVYNAVVSHGKAADALFRDAHVFYTYGDSTPAPVPAPEPHGINPIDNPVFSGDAHEHDSIPVPVPAVHNPVPVWSPSGLDTKDPTKQVDDAVPVIPAIPVPPTKDVTPINDDANIQYLKSTTDDEIQPFTPAMVLGRRRKIQYSFIGDDEPLASDISSKKILKEGHLFPQASVGSLLSGGIRRDADMAIREEMMTMISRPYRTTKEAKQDFCETVIKNRRCEKPDVAPGYNVKPVSYPLPIDILDIDD